MIPGIFSTVSMAILAVPLAMTPVFVAQAQDARPTGATPGKPIKADLPVEVFAAVPFMQSPQLSPDGKNIAVTLSANGARVYGYIPSAGGNPKIFASAGSFKDAGDRDVFGYRWVGNDNIVLTLMSRENIYGQRVDIRRLVSYSIKTQKMTPLAWDGASADAANILHIDHDKGQILLSRQTFKYGTERAFRPEVVKVDVSTGKILETLVTPNPVVSGWYADGRGVVRLGTGYDSDTGKSRLLYRSNSNGQFETIYNAADKDFTGAGIQPQIFLDETDMAIVTDNRSGYAKAYKANLRTMEIGEPIFAKEGYDIGGPIPNEDRNGVLGYSYSTNRGHIEWTDAALQSVQQFLDEEFGKSNARIVSSNDGNTLLLIDVGDSSQPGSYYLYDVKSGSFRLLGHADAAIKEGKVNPVDEVVYTASDGMKIHMAVTMPRHRTGQKNLPVVVLTHGGPYGVRDYAEFDRWAQSVAEAGYVVLQPNYRGSGGYGTEFLKAGRNDGFGTRMQDDLNDAVDYMAAQGIVDSKRACMMGWSYGGYASARAAQRDPARWRCTIAGAGVYDLPKMRDYDRDYLGTFAAGYLAKGAVALSDVSPARNAEGKWSPILIVHGVRDPRVPIAQARTLVSALKSAGKREGVDYEYIEQPKNGHYSRFFTFEESMEWLGGVRNWLAKHNPAYVGPEKPQS